MNIRQTTNICAFAERALPFLRQRPAEHHLILVLVQSLLESPPKQAPALITVDQDGEVVAVALQTAARPLVLSRMSSPAQVDAIAHHIKRCWPSKVIPLHQSLSQFGGPQAETALFAKTLRRWTRLRYRLQLAMRIHQLKPEALSFKNVGPVEGELCLATEHDRDRLIEWSRAFEQEAHPPGPEDHEQWADHGLATESLYFWQTSVGPVCMLSGRCSNNNKGGRIGPVYTPLPYRCQGYATAATAALSQRLFESGCNACYLFTDANNATSNHVYRKVGYQFVGDWSEYVYHI